MRAGIYRGSSGLRCPCSAGPARSARRAGLQCQAVGAPIPWSLDWLVAIAAGAPIVRLLKSSRPNAVCGRVALVIVNALQRVQRGRAAPHVCQKLPEIIPAGGASDTARPVVVEGGAARVATSLPHRFPHGIFRQFMRHAVADVSECRLTVAATGLSLAATDIVLVKRFDIPASALTGRSLSAPSRWGDPLALFKHGQKAVGRAGFNSRHMPIIPLIAGYQWL